MFQKLISGSDVKFLSYRKIALVLSVICMFISIGLFAVKGLNYGIDFKGGITIEIGTPNVVPIAKVRATLSALNLGDVKVQEYGRPTEALIRIERQPGGDAAQKDAIDAVQTALDTAIEGITYRQENVVGPVVSEELKTDGVLSVTVAIFAVLIYIWFRFEWQFGLGAVFALVHDVVLTIGFFSFTELEFNLSIIAALLTIVGYSLNDTVVVYDRVRENIRKFRKKPMEDVLNLSLNQTLTRTIMTSVTTLLALLALFFFGGQVIQGFADAMIWGVVIGTYSSIFVASPVLMMFNLRSEDLIIDDPHQNDPTVDKASRPGMFEQ